MKIILDIPKWAEKRDIHIFAGREVIARKLIDQPLEIKTVRCNLCGECCRKCLPSWMLGQTDGVCNYLKHEVTPHGTGYFCKLRGYMVPFTCCKGRGEDPDTCCIRYEAVD